MNLRSVLQFIMNTAEGWQKGCTSTGNVTLSEGRVVFIQLPLLQMLTSLEGNWEWLVFTDSPLNFLQRRLSEDVGNSTFSYVYAR